MEPARLLDLTRSLRRAGRVATGVDRVEHAYLSRFLDDDIAVFGLFRTVLGYVLLDRAGLIGFRDRLERRVAWGEIGIMARLARGRDAAVRRAETDIRRLACARTLRHGLPRMLRTHLGASFSYFNVGHSNLTDRVLSGVKDANGRVEVMVHDVIPLDHPEFQRPGSVAAFEDKMRRVGAMADRVIYNTAATKRHATAYFERWDRVPPSIVAHLGALAGAPDLSALPKGVRPDTPYFVIVGTIEPRKNHAFLLDLWEEWGADAPPLLICGNRGWNNDAVFARLDGLPADGAVKEVNGLSDAALSALVQNAAGSLFPTHAEGFGLPPVEALALGSRVLCNDLRVLREVLGDAATFIPVFNHEMWLNTLKNWEKHPPDVHANSDFVCPTWADHFKTVLRLR